MSDGQFICHPAEPGRIIVAIARQRWEPRRVVAVALR